MARRLPQVAYEAPSAQDVAKGRVIHCVDCDRPWPLWLGVAALHRCVNHARVWQSERARAHRGGWRQHLGQEDARVLLAKQDGRCASCSRQISLTKAPPARADVREGCVVAFVCPKCLKLIGYGDELEPVARYLRRRPLLEKLPGKTSQRAARTWHARETSQTLARAEIVEAIGTNTELEAEVDQIIASATRKRTK